MDISANTSDRIRRHPVVSCLVCSVRVLVFVGLPLGSAIACWMAWPHYKPRFNATQVARGVVSPLSNHSLHLIPANRKAEPLPDDDAQLEHIVVPHWLAADTTPELFGADEVEEQDLTEPIIGVELDGCYFAFAVAGMANPYHCIVSVASQQQQATVTHCAGNCLTRVFINDQSASATPLALAGLIPGGQYMLVVDGKVVPHDAVNFPREELCFFSMELDDWLHLHPTSQYYPGSLRVSYTDRTSTHDR